MEALKAEGVCRNYGSQVVLKDFSLTVGERRFVALMGPSGSGKSTFLHLAAGLLAADAGSILVGGKDVVAMGDAAAAKFRRRHVGVVFQAFNLLSDKTVEENVLLPLRLDGARMDAGLRARLKALAARLGIDALLAKKPGELSGGEQQRVAIARALLPGPGLVLADEPTGNLDVAGTRAICEILKGVSASSAILVVTHDPIVAACAESVHFMKDGRIVASCEPNGDAALVANRYLEICR